VFVTLTYPDEFPFTPEQWSRDLAALERRMKRQWPELAAIWKKGIQAAKERRQCGQGGPAFPHTVMVAGMGGQCDLAAWIRHWKLQCARVDMAYGKTLLRTSIYELGMDIKIEALGPT
jgi:hypothetical protein